MVTRVDLFELLKIDSNDSNKKQILVVDRSELEIGLHVKSEFYMVGIGKYSNSVQ